MIWLPKVIIELVVMLLAYITNPIIVLLCDEDGRLPDWAWPWITYDNLSCDISWMVLEHNVPSWAEYDYSKHYVYFPEVHIPGGVTPGYAVCINDKFTLKERIQRYFCRLAWLYRNCNYGFSYYVNGVFVARDEDITVVKKVKTKNNEVCICYDRTENWLTRPWCIFYCKQYCPWFRLRLYLGWKLKGLTYGRHMLAVSVNPFKPLEK